MSYTAYIYHEIFIEEIYEYLAFLQSSTIAWGQMLISLCENNKGLCLNRNDHFIQGADVPAFALILQYIKLYSYW